jgi:hypothetical protein
MKRVLAITLFLFVACGATGLAQETDSLADSVQVRISKFVFDDAEGRNIVTFKSVAPLETVLGVGSALYGFVELNLDSLSDNPQAYFEFDLNCLSTGVEQRDLEVFSDVFLMTDSFPDASFKLLQFKKTDIEVLGNEGAAEMTARGEFSLRGVLDTVNCAVKVIYFETNDITERRLPGDLLKIKVGFDIRMSGFGIVIPEEDILMLDDRIHIEVEAFGGTGVEPIDRTPSAEEPVALEGEAGEPIDSSGN